jgi:formylglycine-generating enzyme required for sulfatase activity
VAIVEIAPRQAPEPVATPLFVDLVLIPGGTFHRRENEGPVHEVRVSRFACTRYPVTRRLYAEILGTDPGWPEGEADDRPVNNVSWHDAVIFCNRLSERGGLTPCYQIGKKVIWNRTADGYRLLTEAEWEYACRAGSTSRWSFGDDEEKLGDHAWYQANSNGEPQPVGRKKPNAWGLHDMQGNVYEWCWDWYGRYSGVTATDPIGPAGGGARVTRGGAFYVPPRFLRSEVRVRYFPKFRFRFIGFRCARGASPP